VWARDFLPVIDLFFRQIYAFFIIELGSRRVVHCGVTSHPTDTWVAQQLREATPYSLTPRFLIRDRDSKYGDDFARVAKASSIEVLKTPFRAPKANAICERFLGSVRRECLDHLLVVGNRQLHRVIKEYVGYFNRARPHQGIGQRIPGGDPTPASLAEARKAHRGSGPQWIAPRLPACCVSPESPKQPRTRFSASTVIALGPEYERSMAASIPLKRLGTVEGIAYAGLFLASKEASYIAGQTIVVDGAQIFPES